MGIRMKGLIKAQNSFERLRKNLPREVGRATKDHTEAVFKVTQRRVPKKTTALMRTGIIVPNITSGYRRSYSIWYGEPGEGPGIIDYAAAVHEILKAKHAPGTGPKFVEQPLITSIPEFKGRIKAAIEVAKKESFR